MGECLTYQILNMHVKVLIHIKFEKSVLRVPQIPNVRTAYSVSASINISHNNCSCRYNIIVKYIWSNISALYNEYVGFIRTCIEAIWI